jgi:hypothetical protein
MNNPFPQQSLTNWDFSFGILVPHSLPCAQLEGQLLLMTKKRCAMLQTCAQENKRFLFCDGILV